MKRVLASVMMVALLGAPAVSAQSWAAGNDKNSRQDKDILPLASVIKKLQREQGGRYIDAELIAQSSGRAQYHITWEKDGRKIVFVVDAQSGRIVRQSGG